MKKLKSEFIFVIPIVAVALYLIGLLVPEVMVILGAIVLLSATTGMIIIALISLLYLMVARVETEEKEKEERDKEERLD